MYLSRPAEYGLRAMTHLARLEPGTRISTKELSEAIGVSAPFLSKIMRRLTEAGFLDARKGHHGGFLLASQPLDIRFIDVMRAVDFEPTGDHCLYGLKNCDGENPCPLHTEWGALKGQIEDWARTHTLADVLN